MGNENYRYHDHEKLAHYANAATDIEFKMPFGCEEKLENGETRVVLRLPEALAPVKCAVFPLDKKYGLPE